VIHSGNNVMVYLRPEQVPWTPYGTGAIPTFVSSAIDLDEMIYNPTFNQGLTSFRFK
jgi:hypothetical protein